MKRILANLLETIHARLVVQPRAEPIRDYRKLESRILFSAAPIEVGVETLLPSLDQVEAVEPSTLDYFDPDPSDFLRMDFVADLSPPLLAVDRVDHNDVTTEANVVVPVSGENEATASGDVMASLNEDVVGMVTLAAASTNEAPSIEHGFATHDASFNLLNDPTFTGRRAHIGDEAFVVDTDETYTLTATAFATDADGNAPLSNVFHYLGFSSYDIDGNIISPFYVLKEAAAVDTTLAANLNPGDTTIVLSDASGWYDDAPTDRSYHRRSFAWYGYQDSTGTTYADYTYTRNVSLDLWDNGAISGNVITLRDPWSGPALAAGSAVRNATSGGTYNYGLLQAQPVPDTPTDYSATIGGGIESNGRYSGTLFRPGTHSIRALVLSNYTPCLLYTSPSPRDQRGSRMPSSA